MSRTTRRAVLASTAAALAPLSGCGMTSGADCSPATFPESGTREEPPEPCQFSAELEARGLDVDSTLTAGGGVSVMFYREPDSHSEQIQTLALAFVEYRRMVSDTLSFTALESSDERHGVGYVVREWAARYASGELSRDEYTQKVEGTYGSR